MFIELLKHNIQCLHHSGYTYKSMDKLRFSTNKCDLFIKSQSGIPVMISLITKLAIRQCSIAQPSIGLVVWRDRLVRLTTDPVVLRSSSPQDTLISG